MNITNYLWTLIQERNSKNNNLQKHMTMILCDVDGQNPKKVDFHIFNFVKLI